MICVLVTIYCFIFGEASDDKALVLLICKCKLTSLLRDLTVFCEVSLPWLQLVVGERVTSWWCVHRSMSALSTPGGGGTTAQTKPTSGKQKYQKLDINSLYCANRVRNIIKYACFFFHYMSVTAEVLGYITFNISTAIKKKYPKQFSYLPSFLHAVMMMKAIIDYMYKILLQLNGLTFMFLTATLYSYWPCFFMWRKL